QLLHVRNQDTRALRHLNRVASVANVTARKAKMEPTAGVVIDDFRHGGSESDDIMVEGFLQITLPRYQPRKVRKPFIASSLNLREICLGNDAFLHQCFAGE